MPEKNNRTTERSLLCEQTAAAHTRHCRVHLNESNSLQQSKISVICKQF